MNGYKITLRKILLVILLVNISLFIVNCSKKFNPEPLSKSTRQNLAYLQQDPQFVMYFNFKKMRETEFWKKFMSDSIFNSERNFGSFLNILKNATGASISNGIDELYFSNSWIGDNALLIKGTFDRNKVNDYIKSDTQYTKISYPGDVTVYNLVPMHFYFYFKDDFTVCASNYLPQIESSLNITDTSKAGLLKNDFSIAQIERIKNKEHLWMMSSQKLFIRGIFENLADMGGNKSLKPNLPGGESPDSAFTPPDSNSSGEFDLTNLYSKINSVSFSLKMTDDLGLSMQNECTDEPGASELKNKMDAVIALAKLSAQFSKKEQGPMIKILDKVDTRVYDKTLLIETTLTDQQITELRKQKVF
ncbi:MAG: hypothetical protein EHM58_16040 [Ignavibacteriae bacterium]|nr:MAG: hypothetical protein EHM58_16040 [Ignavibacteriota bacterium]